jgi:hypothetical protein
MPNPGGNDLFALRDRFAALHGFLSQAASLGIPLDSAAFTARYGDVAGTAAVAEIQDALRELREAADASDPKALKRTLAADVRALTGSEPPSGLYPRSVWLAQRAENAAGSTIATFESLERLTEAGVSAGERATAVRNIFNGDRGLIAVARGLAEAAGSVAADAESLRSILTKAVRLFHTTPLLREADDAIRVLESKLQGLRNQEKEAEQRSKGFFGRAKGRLEADELAAQIAETTTELDRKQQLSADLQKFLPGSERALEAAQAIAGQFNEIGGIFNQAASRFSSVVKLADDAQISDYAWLSTAIDLPAALERWRGVQESSRRFVQSSLVDFDA